MVDSAIIQSQAKVFDLGTTAFLTNWENGLSNFRTCLEWSATALSGRGCRPECQRVHICRTRAAKIFKGYHAHVFSLLKESNQDFQDLPQAALPIDREAGSMRQTPLEIGPALS